MADEVTTPVAICKECSCFSIGDGDNWFLEVFVAETDSTQDRAIGCALALMRYDLVLGLVLISDRPERLVWIRMKRSIVSAKPIGPSGCADVQGDNV